MSYLPIQKQSSVTRILRSMMIVGVALLVLWITIKIDLVIFAGVLVSILFHRTAAALGRRTGLSYGWALPLVVAAIVALFAALGWFFFHSVASQVEELSRRLPEAVSAARQGLEHSAFGRMLVQNIQPDRLIGSGASPVFGIFGVASSLFEIGGGLFVIVFIGLYLAVEMDRYAAGLLRLVPPSHRQRAAEVADQTADVLWFWMTGRLFAMSVLGVLTALGLWVLGIPVPIALGLLAALLTFIPYLGAFISAVPSVLLAFTIDAWHALWVVLLFIAVHIVEGYILAPLVQRRTAQVPPALGLAGQVLLGTLAGILGLLFAVPLLAAALVLVRTLYVEDALGGG